MTFQQSKTFFSYLAVAIFSIILFFLIYPDFNLTIPLSYDHDGLFTSATIKSVLESGWYLTNPALAAPDVQHMAEHPASDSASFLIIKFLALFVHHYTAALNLFYFLTFPLTALLSLSVFRLCGLKQLSAVVASLLFAFLPFHFLRGEMHLFLNTYYVVPLYILLIVSVCEPARFSLSNNSVLRYLFYFFISVFAASSGIYYAFFGAYLLLISGLITYFNTKKWRGFFKACCLIAIIFATVFVNISPSFLVKRNASENTEMANRSPIDSELFGLKIIQMVLPVDQHHLRGFAKSKEHYNKIAPLVNENRTATLGVIGTVGFFILLLLLLMTSQTIENTLLFAFSRLTIFSVLLGTIGGLGAIFAFRVSPMIRSYNRISVFIAFFSLCAFFLVLQKKIQKKSVRWIVMIVVACIGLFDQIPQMPRDNAVKMAFENDERFITLIESQLPPGSLIFQFPFMSFPEAGNIYAMQDYDPLRPYLHAHHLRFSYGALKGRLISAWQAYLVDQPTTSALNMIAYAGFVGIYLDRNGYTDHGVQIEETLKKILHQTPLVSSDHRFLFFDLREFVNKLRADPANWIAQTHLLQSLIRHGNNVGEMQQKVTVLKKSDSVLEVTNCATYPMMVNIEERKNGKKTLTKKILLLPGVQKVQLSTVGSVFTVKPITG